MIEDRFMGKKVYYIYMWRPSQKRKKDPEEDPRACVGGKVKDRKGLGF